MMGHNNDDHDDFRYFICRKSQALLIVDGCSFGCSTGLRNLAT